MGKSESDDREKEKPAIREMTPAHVRERKGAEFVEVMFLQSARIYKLFKKNPKFEEVQERLREAVAAKRTVRVQLTAPQEDVIVGVERC